MRIRAIRSTTPPSDILNFYKANRSCGLISKKYSTALVDEFGARNEINAEMFSGPYGKLFFWRFKSIRWYNFCSYTCLDLLLNSDFNYPNAFVHNEESWRNES
jgi:hypothetical protein